MILVVIDNKSFLCKVINYLEKSNIKYTTDINDRYDFLLIAELNKKTDSLIRINSKLKKKIIFITYLEENKIFINYKLYNKKSIIYKSKLYNSLNMCYLIIVSLPFFKKMLEEKLNANIQVVEKEMPYILANKNKDKKIITCIDPDYENIGTICNLAFNYPNQKFQVLGYAPSYNLTNKERTLINKCPTNINSIKYYDKDIFIKCCQNSSIILYFDNNVDNIEYLYMIFKMKKPVLLKNCELYNNYLINSKNVYMFNDYEELDLRFKKILNGRVANLTNEAYDLVKDNNFDKISVKFRKYLQ